MTGKGSPYIGEVLDAAFSNAQAVVVVLTGDDFARLRDDLLALKQAKILRRAGLRTLGWCQRTVSVLLRGEQRGVDPAHDVYRSPSCLPGGSRRRGGRVRVLTS
jgi:hypothetical protein